eukprot:05858.XXX_254308_254412_1 [CDS] Oithona nana genome sequencing.
MNMSLLMMIHLIIGLLMLNLVLLSAFVLSAGRDC